MIRTRGPHLGKVVESVHPVLLGPPTWAPSVSTSGKCCQIRPVVTRVTTGSRPETTSRPRTDRQPYVSKWTIDVRYTEHVDYVRPVEAVVPGATGRVLAALARVEAELPVSTVANIAGVGRTRASGIITELWALGVVERREIGRTVLVSLARHSAAGELIDRLAHLDSEVIARLRSLATKVEPAPETLLIFGSFARGEAEADSDLDVLAVRSPTADPEKWAASLSRFAEQAQALAGNQVQLLDYGLEELRRKAGPKTKEGRDFWRAVRRDAIVLVGSQFDDLVGGTR